MTGQQDPGPRPAVAPDESAAWWPRWPPPRADVLQAAVVVVALVALVVIAQKLFQMKRFLGTLATFEQTYLLPLLLLGLAYYGLKTLRWHYYLREAGIVVRPWRAAAAYLAGQWFTFTPAGELMRGYLLGSGIPFAQVAPTVIVQVLADLLSLAVVATAVVPFYPGLSAAVLPVTLPILAAMLLLATPALRHRAAGWRLLRWLASGKRQAVVEEAAGLVGPRQTAVGLLLGIPAVLTGGFGFYLAGLAVGLSGWDLGRAIGVYAMMQLLGGLSPSPQGLGVTEGSGVLILAYLGIDPGEALAAIVLFRATLLALSAGLGGLALLSLRLADRSMRSHPA